MRIGALAEAVGIPADTIRFYERSGIIRGPGRLDNGYRDYSLDDAAHLRLLIDLRRLDLPLELAATLAQSCHAGHCTTTSAELPAIIERQRHEVADRIDGLRALDERLADLQRHLAESRPGGSIGRAGPGTVAARAGRSALPVLEAGAACCGAASAVMDVAEGGCSCCVAATSL